MSNATFHNFTDKPFTGYWDGKPKTFKAGERVYMPAYLAAHFAKHLTNRELLERPNGKGETYTSPKYPDQVPQFMEIFRKAYIPDEAEEGNALEQEIASVRKEVPSSNIQVKAPGPVGQTAASIVEQEAAKDAQIIHPPAGDDDEEGFEHGGK